MLAAAAAVAFADQDYAKVALAELRPFVAKAASRDHKEGDLDPLCGRDGRRGPDDRVGRQSGLDAISSSWAHTA